MSPLAQAHAYAATDQPIQRAGIRIGNRARECDTATTRFSVREHAAADLLRQAQTHRPETDASDRS